MKKILTIILIISLLFSFGCVQKSGDGSGTTSGKGFTFTGKNGITASFDKDAPPNTNFVYDPIELIIKLTNRGAIDLASGKIQARLKGVAATEIFQPTTVESSNDEELLAAELDPTTATIDLGLITYSPEQMFKAEYKPEIKTEICFPFQTKVSSDNFWVSDKQSDLDKGKVSSADNSDAPVHISKLEEFKGTNKVRFEFIVENVGKGKVVESCFSEEESDEIVEVNVLQPRGVSCETLEDSGSVKLENGRKKVRCSIEVPKGENYKSQLVIRLDYNYDLELSKTITVRNTEIPS